MIAVVKAVGLAVVSASGIAAYCRLATGTRSEVKSFANVMGAYADVACGQIKDIDEAAGDWSSAGSSSGDDGGCTDGSERAKSVLDRLARADSFGAERDNGASKPTGGIAR